jgi:GDP-mannose 6-dehydrogenase
MNISVFGLGYVGCVTAACLSRGGHHVIGLDVNPQKLDCIQAGKAPVIEPGLDELVCKGIQNGSLRVTTDVRAAILESEASLVCVGTPSHGNGSLNLSFVGNVCREIGRVLAEKQAYHVVIVRSTMLPGSTYQTVIPILQELSGRRAGRDFGVCVNPEFLREGSAIKDYVNPSYVVIGQDDAQSGTVASQMYSDIDAPMIHTTIPTAEMLKYACNAFHAVKVTFANEIGNLCRAQGVDGREVMELFAADHRLNISPAYLKPGFAYGGSCLPKDLRALLHRARELDVECPLLTSVPLSNREQVQRAIEMVEGTGCKNIGILGLSFKAQTDDVRESPVVTLAETLVGRGYRVCIYDDKVRLARLVGANKSFLENQMPHIALLMRGSLDEVLMNSQVIVVANNSPAFRGVEQRLLSDQILIDLVGMSCREDMMRGRYEGICWQARVDAAREQSLREGLATAA